MTQEKARQVALLVLDILEDGDEAALQDVLEVVMDEIRCAESLVYMVVQILVATGAVNRYTIGRNHYIMLADQDED